MWYICILIYNNMVYMYILKSKLLNIVKYGKGSGELVSRNRNVTPK